MGCREDVLLCCDVRECGACEGGTGIDCGGIGDEVWELELVLVVDVYL